MGDAMAIMDSFGPDEAEFFQNVATNTCGVGWNHCRAQEATVVDGVDPDFVDIPIPDINGPDDAVDNTASNVGGVDDGTSNANVAADDAAGPGGEIDGNRLRRFERFIKCSPVS